MKWYSYVPSFVRTSVCVAALIAPPTVFGATADRRQVQAKLLDRAELLCDNCFFGPSYYYYCFEADNKILIGYQTTRVLNWEDKSKNYLTKVHKAWTVWTPPGETIPIGYDGMHIWVTRPSGKPVKLTPSSSLDGFITNNRCREAVRTSRRTDLRVALTPSSPNDCRTTPRTTHRFRC